MELVLRLLRGEGVDAISRESQVAAHELEGWKLEHGKSPALPALSRVEESSPRR